MPEVTAVLDEVEFTRIYGARVAVGVISGDTKGRFPDGRRVRTSTVRRVEGDLIHTRNSVYRIGSRKEKK